MANEQNLQPRPPFNSETGREAQKKSVAARKRNKTIRETVEYFLNQPVKDPKQIEAIEKAGLPIKKRTTYQEVLVDSIIMKAISKGRISDLVELQQLLGQAEDSNDMEDSDAFFAAAEIENDEPDD